MITNEFSATCPDYTKSCRQNKAPPIPETQSKGPDKEHTFSSTLGILSDSAGESIPILNSSCGR